MEPRPFFIEDFLEKNRFHALANLGESGLRNYSLIELLNELNVSIHELGRISLADSPNQGSLQLRKLVANLYGKDISEENILITTGTSEALFLLFHLLLKPKSTFQIFLPAFQALYEIPIQLGAVPLGMDISEQALSMESFINEKADLYIINHPHNPTGKGLELKDWNILEKTVPNSSSYFLFDEHYRFLNWKGDEFIKSGYNLSENCFALGSITKCFGVTGLRIGWIVGPKTWIRRIRSFKDYTTHTVNPISEFLCEKILENRERLLKKIKKRILNNIDCFQQNFNEFRSLVEFIPPSGGLVAFPKLLKGIQSQEYAIQLMEERSVFVLPGSSFEKEGFIRVGFGELTEKFQEGIFRWLEWDHQNYRIWV